MESVTEKVRKALQEKALKRAAKAWERAWNLVGESGLKLPPDREQQAQFIAGKVIEAAQKQIEEIGKEGANDGAAL